MSAPYETLRSVLIDALAQAATGKGAERHANGRAFEDQPMLDISRMVGIGGPAFQVMKKAQEACGMASRGEFAAAERELLGAIVYAAGAVLLVREARS